jgi:hypothetical protein
MPGLNFNLGFRRGRLHYPPYVDEVRSEIDEMLTASLVMAMIQVGNRHDDVAAIESFSRRQRDYVS